MAALCGPLGVSWSGVPAAAAVLAVREATAGQAGWVRRHGPDLVLAGTAALLLALALRAAFTPPPAVVAGGDRPAYAIVAPGDLLPGRAWSRGGVLADTAALAGRVFLAPVRRGDRVAPGALSAVAAAPGALAGRAVLRLRVMPESLGPELVPGTRATLVLSPRAAAAEGEAWTVADVLILDRDAAGDTGSVLVALPPGALARVAPLLARTEARLAHPAGG